MELLQDFDGLYTVTFYNHDFDDDEIRTDFSKCGTIMKLNTAGKRYFIKYAELQQARAVFSGDLKNKYKVEIPRSKPLKSQEVDGNGKQLSNRNSSTKDKKGTSSVHSENGRDNGLITSDNGMDNGLITSDNGMDNGLVTSQNGKVYSPVTSQNGKVYSPVTSQNGKVYSPVTSQNEKVYSPVTSQNGNIYTHHKDRTNLNTCKTGPPPLRDSRCLIPSLVLVNLPCDVSDMDIYQLPNIPPVDMDNPDVSDICQVTFCRMYFKSKREVNSVIKQLHLKDYRSHKLLAVDYADLMN